MSTFSRRSFLAGATAAVSTIALTGPGRGATNAPPIPAVRIGTVFPVKTGEGFIHASVNDFIGNGARMGALLADRELARRAADEGTRLDVLLSGSPSVDAAVRAGERLVETGNISALIGGVGEGQAEALAEIATAAKIPFFNIGETSDAFRRNSSRYVFHIEASDAMYLDALGELAASLGYRRWAVVSEESDRGAEMAARIEQSAQKSDSTITGMVTVRPAQGVYFDEVEQLAAIDADVVLVLVNFRDIFALMVRMEEDGITTPVLTFPDTIMQTRDFVATARYQLPTLSPRQRVALWETTNPDPEAERFNLGVRAEWAEPADPTAWAAYAATRIIFETVLATRLTDPEAMIEHLENPETTFDVLKGPGVSFRPWDHQLRQPLYVISVDQDVVWRQRQIDTRIAIARYEATLPDGTPEGQSPQEWLDRLGDGPA